MTAEVLLAALLAWLCVAVSALVGVLLWRHPTRPEPRTQAVWEVVDLAAPPADTQPPGVGSAVQARRVIRELRVPVPEPSAPWDGQPPYRPEAVTFPESWQWEWPDPPLKPSPLPDEEEST